MLKEHKFEDFFIPIFSKCDRIYKDSPIVSRKNQNQAFINMTKKNNSIYRERLFSISLHYINLLFIVISHVFIFRIDLFKGKYPEFMDLIDVIRDLNIKTKEQQEDLNKRFRKYFEKLDWTNSPIDFFIFRKVIVDFLIYFIYSFIIYFENELKYEKKEFKIVKKINDLDSDDYNKYILLFQAVGSVTPSSDYDISIKSFYYSEDGLELMHDNHEIYKYFNLCIKSLFGKASNDLFDTNLYTTDYSIFSSKELPDKYFQCISATNEPIKTYIILQRSISEIKSTRQNGAGLKTKYKKYKKNRKTNKRKRKLKKTIKKKLKKLKKTNKSKIKKYVGGNPRPQSPTLGFTRGISGIFLYGNITEQVTAVNDYHSNIKNLQLLLVNCKFLNNLNEMNNTKNNNIDIKICNEINEIYSDLPCFQSQTCPYNEDTKSKCYLDFSKKLIDKTKEIINSQNTSRSESDLESYIEEYVLLLTICSYLADEAYYSIDTQLHVIERIQKRNIIELSPQQFKHSIIENLADMIKYHKKEIVPFILKVSKYLERILDGIKNLGLGINPDKLFRLFELFKTDSIDDLLNQIKKIKETKNDPDNNESNSLIESLLENRTIDTKDFINKFIESIKSILGDDLFNKTN